MGIKDYIGSEFIGQEDIKRKINFFIESHKFTRFFPPLFLSAPRGLGKTALCRIISRNLLAADGIPKKFIEINGASLKKLGGFIDDIIIPHVVGGQESVLYVDELASVDSSILDWLLSVLEVNNESRTKAFYNGVQYDFDFTKFSFLASTTESQKISDPLKSRFRKIELAPYSNNDLTKILNLNLKKYGISTKDSVENDIVKIARQSPRETVYLAKDIKQYTAQNRLNHFGKDEWVDLRKTLDILPLGINQRELQLLEYLDKNGPSTLTCLSGGLNTSSSCLRQDVELFPLSNGLIKIDVKRILTNKGKQLLEEIRNWKAGLNVKSLTTQIV